MSPIGNRWIFKFSLNAKNDICGPLRITYLRKTTTVVLFDIIEMNIWTLAVGLLQLGVIVYNVCVMKICSRCLSVSVLVCTICGWTSKHWYNILKKYWNYHIKLVTKCVEKETMLCPLNNDIIVGTRYFYFVKGFIIPNISFYLWISKYPTKTV